MYVYVYVYVYADVAVNVIANLCMCKCMWCTIQATLKYNKMLIEKFLQDIA